MNVRLNPKNGIILKDSNDDRRKRDKEVVKKILSENEKLRTKIGFVEADNEKTVLTGEKSLKIYPDEIIFKDIKENQTYEINVMVRNLTKTVKRIRIFQPVTSKFRCDYDMAGVLAPGLAIELIISFSTTTHGDFHDSIKIVSDGNLDYEIPLHAYSPSANIVFEPFLNLGFINVGQEKRLPVKFKNEGIIDGRVELKFTDLPDFRIEPSPNFKIKAGKTHEVDFVYFPREAGIFRGIIEVYVEGQTFMNHIDVNATSVEFLKFIVDEEGNEMSKVDFGEVFFGAKKEIKGYLVNNSPKPFKFRVNFVSGLHSNYDEKNNLMTPMQVGLQQTQRVMSITPSQGIIDTYSQMPIVFSCHSKVQEDHIIWVRNNCFKKSKLDKKTNKMKAEDQEAIDSDKSRSNHEYTALFNFDGVNESKLLMMTAACICPRISIGEESNFNFGLCPVNQKKEIELGISNLHNNLDLEIYMPNISIFYVKPSKVHLKAGEKKIVVLTFEPKNLGNFSKLCEFMINNSYPVSITFLGQASIISAKEKRISGPLPINFNKTEDKKFRQTVGELEAEKDKKNRAITSNGHSKPNDRLTKMVETTQDAELPMIYNHSHATEKLDDYQIAKFNKTKYNDYLKDMRDERLEKGRKAFIVTQNKIRNDRIKSYAGKMSLTTADGFTDTLSRNEGIDSPRLNIPSKPDTLFVMKPIANYEPYVNFELQGYFSPETVSIVEFTDKPASHSEARDVTMELTGEELQKIQVGPNVVEFGSVFVKSNSVKYFQVKNDLRKSVSVRVVTEGIKELEGSFTKTQIIPSGRTGSFKICLVSFGEQNFSQTISYIINEKHFFKILVKADVTPVVLNLRNSEEEFVFEDTSLEMVLTKTVYIKNDGNAVGQFAWNESKTGWFSIDPMADEVAPRSQKAVRITYKPSGTRLNEEEELIFKVLDGNHRSLFCRGTLSEVKCEFTQDHLDFGIMCVSEKKTVNTVLRNLLQKYFAVFEVDKSTLPAGMELAPMRDRIQPEEGARFDVTFSSNKETSYQDKEILVNLRGAQPKKLKFSVQTIIPKISISEEEFDFGDVTFGNTESQLMTIVNGSDIDVVLHLDLRENEADLNTVDMLSRLEIKYLGSTDAEESLVLEEKDLDDMQKPDTKGISALAKDDPLEESDQEEEEVNDKINVQTHSRFFTIKLRKNKTYTFELKFSPKNSKTYNFYLPVTLAGFNDLLPGLRRKVHCRGITPKLIMEPIEGEVVFEKKIITSMDSVIPQHSSITLSNSHSTRPLSFRIDISKLEKKEIFTVIPTQGTIDPQVPVTIKIGFKPIGSEVYSEELPLYLEDDLKPYTTIKLKGEGAYPKLLFDRREVIMPVVPLGIESRCSFKIDNEGYQNLTLKHYLAQDIGAIDLKVEYPEGRTLGLNSNQIKIDLSFKSDKPISFTTKLIFEDEAKQTYPIFISGTADNCLLTTYPFFQTNGEDYHFVAEANKQIRLEDNANDVDSEASYKNHNDHGPFSRQGTKSNHSKSLRSTVGFVPIPLAQLERSCKYCMVWLNEFVLSVNISNFPGDVIQANGSQIFELISFLTKRNPPQAAKIDLNSKRLLKIDALYKQYNDLLHFLKENGAMLNTIRPEYLFNYQDLLTYYRKNPNPNASISANKISEKNHKYISMDSWSTLFYQILKIYYLCRINLKGFRQLKEVPTDKTLMPDSHLENCAIYSQAEIILLRWIEIQIEKVFPVVGKVRLLNFDSDMRNGLSIGSLLQVYIGNTFKKLFTLKSSINSEEDMKNNVEKVKDTLIQYGIMPQPEIFEHPKPSAREFLLYSVHLYQILPFFLPKGTLDFPVMLKGTCVRNVILSNPSSKPIQYWVKLEAPGDFSIEKEYVKLEPKDTSQSFAIKYQARISKTMKGRITFRNKRDVGSQATALVFDLISDVQGRNNEEVIKVEEDVQLYESTTFEVTIQNTYPQAVNYTVRMENIPVILEDPKKKKLGKKPGQADDKVFVPAFFCKSENISIPKGGTYRLPIYYLPVTLEPHKCFIIFTDERLGEMQYEVSAEPQPPGPFEQKTQEINLYLDNLEQQWLEVSKKNPKMDMAISKLKERIKESKAMQNKADVLKKIDILRDNNLYYLECDQPFIQIPTTFNLQGTTKKIEEASRNNGNLSDTIGSGNHVDLLNKIPINFLYKFPVQNQLATILMRNPARNDVRIYQLRLTILPKKVKALLEMSTPARIPLVQNIPIINTLDQEVSIKLSMERVKNGEAFKIPHPDQCIFRAPVGQSQLKLVFEPEWTHEYQAKLTLNNKSTNECFEYEIKGVGEEPLAEKEILVECKVKEESVVYIELENPKKQVTSYQVEIDLPFASGPQTFDVPGNKVGRYPLRLFPLIGEEFTGSVTFKLDTGVYFWYMVTAKVESSKLEKHLDITSHCRKLVTQEIELENPLNEVVTYKATLESDTLRGDSNVIIPAKGKGKYTLTFFPLTVFREKASLILSNEKLGEIVYDILLVSEAAPIVKLPLIKCEIGKTETILLKLENVVNQEVKVSYNNPGSQCFFINSEIIVLPPNGTAEVELSYVPCELDSQDNAILAFDTDEIGSWLFRACGMGIPPTRFRTTEITGSLNKESTNSVMFKNPFKEVISVSVELEALHKNAHVFTLVMKKTKLQIGSQQSLEIPFNFCPVEITDYEASIIVKLSDKIGWKFPITAITESINTSSDYRIITQCHQKKESRLEFQLPGITNINAAEEFEIKVSVNNKEVDKMLNRWLTIEPEVKSIKQPSEALRYNFKLVPHKPFKVTGEIVIVKPSGGRWRYFLLT